MSALRDGRPTDDHGEHRELQDREHRGAADVDTVLYWSGRVLTCRFEGAKAVLGCEPRFISLRRGVQTQRFTGSCRHALYGLGCGVASSSYQVQGALTAVAGNVINASVFGSQPDGYFTGGFVVLANMPRRFIISHVGDQLTLSGAVPGLKVGDSIIAKAGCDHLIATCDSKFSNLPRFGGFAYRPARNPHDNEGLG